MDTKEPNDECPMTNDEGMTNVKEAEILIPSFGHSALVRHSSFVIRHFFAVTA